MLWFTQIVIERITEENEIEHAQQTQQCNNMTQDLKYEVE